MAWTCSASVQETPGRLDASWSDGRHTVHVAIALDRFDVLLAEGTTAARAGLARAVPVRGERRRVQVASPELADRHGFETRARQLAAARGVTEVCAIAHDPQDAGADWQRVTHRVAIRLAPGMDAAALERDWPLTIVEAPVYAPEWRIVETRNRSPLAAIDAADRLRAGPVAEIAIPLLARRHHAKADPNDPLLGQQWHLKNTAQIPGSIAGNDINVAPVWDPATGIHGEGITIAVVDEGVATDHPDLSANCRTDIDIDLNSDDDDPRPERSGSFDSHGTVVAGLAAARGDNGVGVTGVAYRAGIVGVRLISAPSTDQQDATAMAHHAVDANPADVVHISNNSWGASDNGRVIDGPGPLMATAIASSAANGRGGRGTIYVWAAGNGARPQGGRIPDNASYDGFVNSRYVIAVGASDSRGQKELYSESGCCLLVNAPGGNNDLVEGIVSTDRVGSDGYDTGGSYTTALSGSGGTSWAAPITAGACALVLQANPLLTWRDLQHVLARSATKNDASDPGWVTNGGGLHFNHKHGFGRVDVTAAVGLATGWTNAPRAADPVTGSDSPVLAIPDQDNNPNVKTPVSSSLTVSAPADFRIEHVELTVDALHPYRGDLSFALTTPDGTVSSVPERVFDNQANLSWTFVSVAHWGEHANGTWTLTVTDHFTGWVGTLRSWSLRIHGYRPHPIATIAASEPDGIDPGSATTVLTVAGTGFATDASGRSMTTATWNGTPVAVVVLSPTLLMVTVPSAIIGPPGQGSLVLTNPPFLGEGGGVST
ncbi:MAG: S8 family serine peptidase, partial [Planctomycetes bacterium]|nr:S8 family serine peptidase [Planctomycetota bacterium]